MNRQRNGRINSSPSICSRRRRRRSRRKRASELLMWQGLGTGLFVCSLPFQSLVIRRFIGGGVILVRHYDRLDDSHTTAGIC